MTNRVFFILTVLLHLLIFCRSQLVNYECDFDAGLIGDCIFTAADGGPGLVLDAVGFPAGNPRQPYSDVSAIRSRTTPNNEPCILPYAYPPAETWQMYFCRRNSATNYTCPTASGVGQCVVGKYGLIKMPTSGSANFAYLNNVQRSSNTVQCLDFYYYMSDTLENAKLQVEWKKDEDTQQIVEVTALSENKWQHSQTDFTVPRSLSSYQIVFRTLRDRLGFPQFFFALDEIKIYDDSCDSIPTTTTPIPPMTIIDASTTVSILPDTTIPSPATTVTIPPAGSTQSLKPDVETSTTSIPIVHTSTMKTSPLTDLFLSTISTQINILKTSPYPSSITMQENTSTSITFAVNTNVTTTETPIITSSPPPETNSNLAFILALALGIPISLAFIGGIFYYCEVIKPKHRGLVNGTATTTDIPMAPTTTT